MNVNSDKLLQEALQQVTLGPNKQIIGDAVTPQKALYFTFQHEGYKQPILVTRPINKDWYKVLIPKPYTIVDWNDENVYVSAHGNTMEELTASWNEHVKSAWGYRDSDPEHDKLIEDIIKAGPVAYCNSGSAVPDGDSTYGSMLIINGKFASEPGSSGQ